MNNNNQATTSNNTIARSNKQEEGTSYAATYTGHHSNSSANGRQANSNKTVRKHPLTVIIIIKTSILSVLMLLYSCFIMPC